jgi:hypothetical protein
MEELVEVVEDWPDEQRRGDLWQDREETFARRVCLRCGHERQLGRSCSEQGYVGCQICEKGGHVGSAVRELGFIRHRGFNGLRV